MTQKPAPRCPHGSYSRMDLGCSREGLRRFLCHQLWEESVVSVSVKDQDREHLEMILSELWVPITSRRNQIKV